MIRQIAIGLSAGVLALASGSMSLARISERNQPALALSLPFHSGLVEADAARSLITAARQPDNPQLVSLGTLERQRVLELSTSARRKEPLSARALSNLGLVAGADGDAGQALALMQAGASLSRRDTDINGWLLAYHASRNDAAAALQVYDQVLRESEQARADTMPTMVQFLANEELVEPITGLLRKNPPWQRDFWEQAWRVDPALENAAAVRINLAGRDYAGDARTDQLLLDALVRTGRFAQAEQLYLALGDGTRTGQPVSEGQLVNNGQFDNATQIAPFDWEVSFDTFYSAALEPSAGRMRIETFADGSGRVARNLVQLEGSAFTLATQFAEWDALDKDALYLRLRCAEAGSDPEQDLRIMLSEPEQQRRFTKPDPQCRWYWLDLVARAQPQQADNVLTLDSIAIRPLSRGE